MAKVAPPVVNVDPIGVIVTTLSAVLGIATLRLVAYRYHGHPLAQAFLLIV
jgi:hypothetical protein